MEAKPNRKLFQVRRDARRKYAMQLSLRSENLLSYSHDVSLIPRKLADDRGTLLVERFTVDGSTRG